VLNTTGILPGGSGWEYGNTPPNSRIGSGRQDAALYGSQDGCRYNSPQSPQSRAQGVLA